MNIESDQKSALGANGPSGVENSNASSGLSKQSLRSALSAYSNFSSASSNADPNEMEVKVVMVGESAVGKTSFVLKFVTNHFKETSVATIGASFVSKKLLVNQRVTKFNIWDTAGQEKYRSLAALYYRGVDCAVIMYDITDKESFRELRNYWIPELKHQCYGSSGLQLCIVGNKSDLTELREVSLEEGRQLADDCGAMFYETSAKLDENFAEIFAAMALEIPERSLSESSTGTSNQVHKIHIPERKPSLCC